MTASSQPLHGRRILVTRRSEQALPLVQALEARGAAVVELPAIEIVAPDEPKELDDALGRLESYDWVVFTSSNAVRAVRERMERIAIPLHSIEKVRVAAVGPTTCATADECFPGLDVHQSGGDYSADGLLQTLGRHAEGRRFLIPTSDRARPHLPQGLRALGADVHIVVAYRTLAPRDLGERLQAILLEGLDLAVFASPSSIENLSSAAKSSLEGLPCAVMGRLTEGAAREALLDVRVVASPSTVEDLVTAIERHLAR